MVCCMSWTQIIATMHLQLVKLINFFTNLEWGEKTKLECRRSAKWCADALWVCTKTSCNLVGKTINIQELAWSKTAIYAHCGLHSYLPNQWLKMSCRTKFIME